MVDARQIFIPTIHKSLQPKESMATLLPTSPVPSFPYIGSFVVETEDDEDDVVQSIPPSPIEVGNEYHDDDDDDDDGSSIFHESPISIEDINDEDDDKPAHVTVVDGEDYDDGNGCCIDHTALLLGDEYYEEEEDDDEREWNASFSLDELERSNDYHADEMKEQPPHEIAGDGDELDDDGINYNNFEVQKEDKDDYQSCTLEFLHFTDGFAATDNLSVLTSTNTAALTDVITPTTQREEPPPQPQHQQVLRHASSLPTAIYPVPTSPPTYSRSLRRHDTSYILSSSQPSAMIQNDVWRREEEEQQAYATMPRKKINTFENKKKRATMKALAMKERASSALVSRATRAKDKLKEKMTNSTRSAPVQDDDNQLQKQQRRLGHEKTMHGMEMSTREHDNGSNVTSLVSSEVSPLPSSSSLSNLPRIAKKAQMMNRAISSLSSDTNSPKEGKTSTNNCYGALSQRAHRAKVKALGTMNSVLTAAESSTSSATSSNSISSSSLTRRQQTNDKKTTKQQIIDTVFSMEDEDSMSDIPSVLNSEGPSSIQDVSYDGSSIAVVSVRSDGRRNFIHSNTTYSTPKTNRGTRKKAAGGGQEIGLGSSSNSNTMEQSMAASGIISPSHIYSPEQILANLSNISLPTTAADESYSVDGNGFLNSPSSASVHRRWDEEDGRRGDVASLSKAAMLPTVGSALSSEGGGSTFDPNSFLFLSPLSDHDLDDPDYGMPFLLSRSNSHNAVVMDRECTTPTRPSVASGLPPPPPPPPGSMTMTSDSNLSTMKSSSSPSPTMSHSKRFIMRFPASPRLVPSPKLLPPSGKKIMKKMKLGGGGVEGSSGVIVKQHHGNFRLITDRPPLIKNRAQSSTF